MTNIVCFRTCKNNTACLIYFNVLIPHFSIRKLRNRNVQLDYGFTKKPNIKTKKGYLKIIEFLYPVTFLLMPDLKKTGLNAPIDIKDLCYYFKTSGSAI